MTDSTAGGHIPRADRAPRWEFRLYFTLILTLALPVSVLRWGWTVLHDRRLPAQGPVARACSDARIITPLIFSA